MFFENNEKKLFYREWLVSNPKASIVIAHGLGEHSGRYQHVAETLNQAGYSVFALDHQGHGQSEGQRGHVNSFGDYHADLHVFIQMAKSRYPGKDVHLLGHSMGAMIATGYVLRYDGMKSVILTAPPYGVPGKSANLQLKIGAFIGGFLPMIGLSNKIDPKDICKNPEVVQKYIDDELVHDTISLGWGRAFVDEQQYNRENLPNIKLPFLLMLAKQDLLTDCQVAEDLFPSVGSENKKLMVYPDSYHEILNEVKEGADAINLIIGWLGDFS